MDHQKILSKIDEAVIKEEMALPIYTSHITNALFWSGLDKEKQDVIIKNLETLKRESLGHVRAFKRIKEIYIEEIQNKK